ncbi:MAG: hypothetical protein GXP29_10870 [Planctomycetes bacterium]|nr:hypothetical protein [Planctomycetota bacterium]
MKQLKILSAFVAVFLIAYLLPLSNPKVAGGTLMGFVQRMADSKGWNRGMDISIFCESVPAG